MRLVDRTKIALQAQENIPGAIEPQSIAIFSYLSSKLPDDALCLEFGVLHGKSAASLSTLFKEFVLIDPNEPSHLNDIKARQLET